MSSSLSFPRYNGHKSTEDIEDPTEDNLVCPQHDILASQQKTQADCFLPAVASAKSVVGIHLTFSRRN